MKKTVRIGALLAGLQLPVARAALSTLPAAAGSAPSGAGGLLQAGFGLLVVLALVFACAWVVKRLGLPLAGGGERIVKLVATTAVGQRERVVVVEVGGDWLVLGVASGTVRHLHTMPARAAAPQPASPRADAPFGIDAATFAQKLRAALGQPKGRP